MRTCLCFGLVTGWLLLPALVTQAADTHQGKVVSVQEGTGNSDGKLVMTDKDSKDEHSHMISSNTKIMRDNKSVKLGDLKKGDSITVTTNSDGKVTELAAMQRASGSDAKSELPDFLSNLNLTAEQKQKIKDICQQCDGDRETAWEQFEQSCREAIGIEASMLAAIEDHLTDEQRKHVRQHRQRITRSHNGAAKEANHDAKANAKASKNDNVIVEEITVIGVTLSPEQEDAAEGVRGSYFDRLRKLNAEMQELHGRLVAMETERLLKIEEVLTKEQRQQLRKNHQKISDSEKHASTGSSGGTK